MKLISLLKIIPDECTIRLASFEDCCVGDVGTKDDVIAKFASRNKLSKKQVESMNVYSVCPCAYVQCEEAHLFVTETPPLYVKPQIIIEIE